ncbi:MAG: DUF1015 domain-containing protein [Tepidanaerobacteraceae bacterium]|jgi:uncharacterized protein (DUF1015 family)|nr:DUF1015 domain-containing protein [Thermoanaerobacterales bacterium]
MATIKPFKAFRPTKNIVSQVAALPYDVVTTEEAKKMVRGNKYSFLRIDRPEIDFEYPIDIYDKRVYEKARENLNKMIEEKVYVQDEFPCLYIYQLNRQNRIQKGIVACTSIDDYLENVIKKHEHTLQEKEQDRINHVDYTNAHTGPILMTYNEKKEITKLVDDWTCAHTPIYDFVSSDNVTQTVWIIDDKEVIDKLINLFHQVEALYIADGHHRAAAAVQVCKNRRAENPTHTGSEEYNYFLSVIFPDNQLTIYEYNRVIKDLDGLNEKELLEKIMENFELVYEGEEQYVPKQRHFFGMYLKDQWFGFKVKPNRFDKNNPVDCLDVSILHNLIISPIFNISDPRSNNRIDFIGGAKGLTELEKRVNSGEMKIAFTLFHTPIEDLIRIADAGCIMPPKSTWFEPKLQSGIFIHSMSE